MSINMHYFFLKLLLQLLAFFGQLQCYIVEMCIMGAQGPRPGLMSRNIDMRVSRARRGNSLEEKWG